MSVRFSLSVWCNCTFTAFQSIKTALNAVFFSVKYLFVFLVFIKTFFIFVVSLRERQKQRFLTINLMYYETI